MKKYHSVNLSLFFLLAALILLSACGSKAPACPTPAVGTPRWLTDLPQDLTASTPTNGNAPLAVEIGRRVIQVDRVVEGPLCNDSWSGTVYVTCNVQVYEWKEDPTFLKNCNLSIAPGTVVYVAAHNDTAYYNGCSCHTTSTITP